MVALLALAAETDVIAQDLRWLHDSSAITKGLSDIAWGSVTIERLGRDASAQIWTHAEKDLDSDGGSFFGGWTPRRSYSIVRDIPTGRALAIVGTSAGDRAFFAERIVVALTEQVETYIRRYDIDSLEGSRYDRILFTEPRTALFRLSGALLARALTAMGAKDVATLEDEARLDAIGRRVTGSDDRFFSRELLAMAGSTGRPNDEWFITRLERHYGRAFEELRSARTLMRSTVLDTARALGRSIIARTRSVPDSLYLAVSSDDNELRLVALIGVDRVAWRTYPQKDISLFEVRPPSSRLESLGLDDAIAAAFAAASARASAAYRPYANWSRFTFPFHLADAIAAATNGGLTYCACSDVWDAARHGSIATEE